MDLPVAGGERLDCGMGWDGRKLWAVVNMINVWVPQNAGNFSCSSRTNKSVSKDSVPWRWLGLN
jgi:hypothetical protein